MATIPSERPMETVRVCQQCRKPLPAGAPQGLCPQCLLGVGMAPSAAGQGGAAESATPPAPRPVPGGLFGGYRIRRQLGQGGMGEVFEAEQLATGRLVALKVMGHELASEADRKRFLREGRLAAAVNHPNVVYIHGSEEVGHAPVIAMELVHGGTLNDRLRQDGPLPVAEAVEAALQIIAGLEAAQAAGVLHRDIKPANCFVSTDGTVKIGDFGLSVSTLARGESLLTARGAVLGTPAYASPEQLRGAELAVTSDIYSVGASLYHLLTGQPPFQANDFVKLITEVLDQPPVPPSALRREIPPALSRLLLRCLAKDPRARFQSYAELRDALLPFRAGDAVPAKPGTRFLADLLDNVIAYGPSLLFLAYWSLDPMDWFLRERTLAAGLWLLGTHLWYLAYYTVAEGIWGGGVGKVLCGLRVVGADRQPPGLLRAAWRSVVFMLPWVAPSLVLMAVRSHAELRTALLGEESMFTDWLWLPLMIALFVTMRRRNGYAAVHDLVSGTRVIVRPRTQPRPRLAESATAPVLAPTGTASTELGPYQVQQLLWERAGESLYAGLDPVLRRKVWLHLRSPGAPVTSTARRDLSRPARLRWLNAGTEHGGPWDAYEALEGAPLLGLGQRPRAWSEVRFWLLDLAEELVAALRTPATAPVLALDRVWVTSDGRAVLLEFPAPGLLPTASGAAVEPLDGPAGGQRFLHAVRGMVPLSPPPLHAREFLARLGTGAFEKLEYVVGNLHSLVSRAATVTRARRAATLALAPGSLLALAILLAAIIGFQHRRMHRASGLDQAGGSSLELVGNYYLTALKDDTLSGDTNSLDLMRIYLVAHHGANLTNEAFWKQPEVAATFDLKDRELLRQAVLAHPIPDPNLVAAADRSIGTILHTVEAQLRLLPLWLAGVLILVGLFCTAGLELAGAICFRQSPILRLFGLDIVDATGEPAGRGQLVARWLVGWVPAGLIVGLAAGLVGFVMALAGPAGAAAGAVTHGAKALAWGGIPVLLGLLAGAVVYSVRRPDRGLPDRLVGTSLVPR